MLKKLAMAKRSTCTALFGISGLWIRKFAKKQYRKVLRKQMYDQLARTAYTSNRYYGPIIDTTCSILED